MSPPAARSLYVHVPFCLSVCPYCDFVVFAGRSATEGGGLLDPFVRAVLAELELRTASAGTATRLDTVYLGGGTPGLLGARRVATLLEAIDARVGIDADAEITIELNPGVRDRGDIGGFVAAGVNRVSIGAQSLRPAELRRLGRRHTPGDIAATAQEAHSAGARSVSVDLLYDVPGQTLASWRRTVEGTLALELDHVSAYALTLDDPDAEGLTGSGGDHLPLRPGARRWRARAAARQDPDRAAAMYGLADDLLGRAGLAWYELSNWARPGHRSRHNLAYWLGAPHLALGPGAHGFDGRRRWWNAARLAGYLAALVPGPGEVPVLPPGGAEAIDRRDALFERAMLALRLADGLHGPLRRSVAGDRRMSEALGWAGRAGLLATCGDALTLTTRGRLLADELFVRMA